MGYWGRRCLFDGGSGPIELLAISGHQSDGFLTMALSIPCRDAARQQGPQAFLQPSTLHHARLNRVRHNKNALQVC